MKRVASALLLAAALPAAAQESPQALYAASSLGAPGTGRILSAVPALERYVALGGWLGFFTGQDFLPPGGRDTLTTLWVSGSYNLIPWLDLMVELEGGRNFNDANAQPVLSYGVDTSLGARLAGSLGDVSGAVAAAVKLLAAAGSPLWDLGATGLDARLIGTWAPEWGTVGRPVRLHANAGFVLDNSRALDPGPLPPLYRFATRISDFNRLLLGLSVEAMHPRVALFAETAAEIPVGAGVPAQLWIVPGARFTLVEGLQVRAAVELGFGGDPDRMPAVMPWTVTAALLYTFTPFPERLLEERVTTERLVVRVRGGRVTGWVMDRDTGRPIYDAAVSFPGSGLSAALTDPEGRFAVGGLEAGERPLYATALGYEAGDLRFTVPEDSDTAVEVRLAPIPTSEYASWSGRVEDEAGKDLKAEIFFPRARGLSPNRYDVEGDFRLRLPPGQYEAEIRSAGRLTTGRRLALERKQEQSEVVTMRPPPAERARLTEEKIEIPYRIEFAFNEDTILPASFPVLDDVVDILLNHRDLKFRIEGHTDVVGSDSLNLDLSKRRALSVAGYLSAKGVDPQRLATVGFGSFRPITSNSTEEGRARNRRVEFVVTGRMGAM